MIQYNMCIKFQDFEIQISKSESVRNSNFRVSKFKSSRKQILKSKKIIGVKYSRINVYTEMVELFLPISPFCLGKPRMFHTVQNYSFKQYSIYYMESKNQNNIS